MTVTVKPRIIARFDFSKPDNNRRLVMATTEVLEANGERVRPFRNAIANLIKRKRVPLYRINTWVVFWLCQRYIIIYPERGSRGYATFVETVGPHRAKQWAESHPEYLEMIEREDKAAAA